ncbi:MAG: hypothetical protein FJZ47_02930 [Candidatus Tectomicrobia bacterium]|uniref:SIR2-like domain-containing protein n=1 Tax=Tectimicrobiota bacterium TaxID=2528274 RepID=A0A937W009_UNCTE|nr:hypothetical protein [Candidatus Tectomicrobia bacterium]
MSEQQRLQRTIADLQQQWEQLRELIAALQQEHIVEPRPEERLRLQRLLDQRQAEHTHINAELQRLESAVDKAECIAAARQLERNQAYADAVRAWEAIQALDPSDPSSHQELQRLQARQQRAERLQGSLQQLTRRMLEIKDCFAPLARQVKQMIEGGEEDETLLALVSNFLDGTLSAAELSTMFQALVAAPSPTSAPTLDFRALAARMQRGEIVYFLGSDIPALFASNLPNTSAVVQHLAAQVNYPIWQGSLSQMAECYHLKPEYGRAAFVQQLQAVLPDPTVPVPLYNLLARLEAPLTLISAAYDTLLEQAFQRAGKPYVLATSLLGGDGDTHVGQVVLQYSDREGHEAPCLEQTLSDLDVLNQRYSLIYKIRGYLGPHTVHGPHQRNGLTISEDNYFTLARYLDKVIPNYLVRQLSGRGLWFIGYTPQAWEDRLLINALLTRRYHQAEPANVVCQTPDNFEEAYWAYHRVRRHAWSLPEFVQRLEGHI